jgi:SSS family solute:Na+ symporter/sodium/pantothenate symporter
MGIELAPESGQVLIAFACYLAGVILLGLFSHRYLKRGSFIKQYFLGNRGLGAWVLALTVVGTAITSGSFLGFPALIYTNGWVMALWISSYMTVPFMYMALMGKRLNQVARLSGAVTVPDVLRDRFGSPALGLAATSLILIFMTFNLLAQFKGGALVLSEAFKFRPAAAKFLRSEITPRYVVLHFRLESGELATQRVPLPQPGTVLSYVQDEPAERAVALTFERGPETVTRRIDYPPQRVAVGPWRFEKGYLLGLLVFALTVVAYTAYGGYWAVTWTDVLAGFVMFTGVIVLTMLSLGRVAPVHGLHGLAAASEHLRRLAPPGDGAGALVYGPGPNQFLPLGMAVSFFLMWSLMSPGQPSGMVRMMSFKDTQSHRRALLFIGLYYVVTYVCLLVIFICARAIFPTEYLRGVGSRGEPDSIMPAMIRHLAHPLVAGLLLAAPFAAIMSPVAAYLLMISSSLVRDLYQRTLHPKASPRLLSRLSYLVTVLVGSAVTLASLNPPEFIQYVIVFTGSGLGCAFLIPMFISLYWRRATQQGVLAGMLGGFGAVFSLYLLGWIDSAGWFGDVLAWIPGWGASRQSRFLPIYLGGVDPLVWGLTASLLLSVGVSLATRPDAELVAKYFPDGNAAETP